MKKTTLAASLATLLSLGVASSVIAQGEQQPVSKNIQIKMDKSDDGQAVLKVKQNGDVQVFELSESEVQDADLLAERLAQLDDKTRTMIISALNGVDVDVQTDDGEHQVFIIKKHQDGKTHAHAHTNSISHAVSEGISKVVRHKIIEDIEGSGGKKIKIKLGGDADPASVLKHMLESGQFSQEQLDAIEQQLNAKRAI